MRKNVQRRRRDDPNAAWVCIIHYLDADYADEIATDRRKQFGSVFRYRVVGFEQTCTCAECCRMRNGPSSKLPEFMYE
jgi:hypothetical protein